VKTGLESKNKEYDLLKQAYEKLRNKIEQLKEKVDIYKEELVEILAIYEEKMNDISLK